MTVLKGYVLSLNTDLIFSAELKSEDTIKVLTASMYETTICFDKERGPEKCSSQSNFSSSSSIWYRDNLLFIKLYETYFARSANDLDKYK